MTCYHVRDIHNQMRHTFSTMYEARTCLQKHIDDAAEDNLWYGVWDNGKLVECKDIQTAKQYASNLYYIEVLED